MTRIQQSVDINVAAHAVYALLTQFEEYPRFMPNVEAVRRIDDAHFHWSKKAADHQMEWDTEITEQLPDRLITWHNLNGPRNDGRIELQTVGPEQARVTVTMECEPGQRFSQEEDNTEAKVTQGLARDLRRFKDFAEAHARSMSASNYAAGSEGWNGSEDSEQLLADSHATEQREPSGLQENESAQKSDLQQSIERAVPPSNNS